MQSIYSPPAGQTGATLIVALIFLLVMTAAGVTAMRFATFEERMTSNTQFGNQMFQQAQSELRSHMLEFNTSVALRAPLLLAKDKPKISNAAADAASLPKTAGEPQPLAANRGVTIQSSQVLFAVELPCTGSSAEKFTCLHFEMQTVAALGTANSSQTQGITYEAAK
ncbi:MAG: pilus assembly protein PilX [Pseudomonadaceae bacterium]|nr:pilus assembly protein PilX [Pseudomonadaceae bacterium]